VAPLRTAVLLVAEPGVDTDSIARELHVRGSAPAAPFVSVACDGAAATALESDLFGIASDLLGVLEPVAHRSRLAAASGGTLFLQNVGDLPASLQTRLAHVVRDAEMRVGAEVVHLDVRLVASAAPSIDADVRERRFRADLFRRLAASRVDVPSLRDRPEDVPAIAQRLLQDLALAHGAPRTFTDAAIALVGALAWPGNVAELRGVLARVVEDTAANPIQVEHVLPAVQVDRAASGFSPAGTLRDARQRFERDYITAVLRYHAWRVAEAAQTLGIQRPNLYRKARQLGIPLTRLSD
jgi:DNA-binding NtrC family response regulator